MLLIKNGKIYPMVGPVLPKASILIDQGKIVKIQEEIEETEEMEVIDAGGNLVLPGFIDAHCHLGMWEDSIGFEGSDGNEAVDPVTPELRAIDGLNPMDITLREAYEGGVTTAVTGPGSANVIGGSFLAIKTYGHRVDDMVVKNPIGMKVAFGENPKRVYNSQGKSPTTRMATAAILRETLFKAREYLEKKEGADKEENKPAFNMKYEALIPVLKKEIPLKAHAHRADDIFTALRIAREFDLDITLDHCTDGHLIADDLARENKPAIVGPSLGDRSKFELKNLSFETPRVLREKGVKVAITTDSPVTPLQYLPLCAALAHKEGLDEMEALRAITIYPAEITGIDHRVGSLELGKDGDIVIIQGNPMKDVDYRVLYTIIDGKLIHKL